MPATAPESLVSGLSEAEANRRLQEDGHNELAPPGRARRLLAHLEVLREPMFALLVGASILYALLGEPVDALVLGMFATVSVSIAVIQRGRSDRVLAALRDLSTPRALVIRDGTRKRIPGRDVVAGDLLVINEGDRMPADAVLASGDDVMADESLLTGESVPVGKRAVASGAAQATQPGGDDLPQLYSGTLIVRGSGLAVATATGSRAEIGKIDAVLREVRTARVGLQLEVRRWVIGFALTALAVSSLAVLVHGASRGNWLEALLAGVALGMSLLPEEIPLVLSVFTVMGAWRLSASRVLTRRPATIETLGAVTVLCTDKTGTLTQNRMSIAQLRGPGAVWTASDGPLPEAAPLLELLHTAGSAVGPESNDPMDRAIAEMAARCRATETRGVRPLRTYPVRAGRPMVIQVWPGTDAHRIAAKGAPEAIAALCPQGVPLSALDEVTALAADGIRVLAVAHGEWPAHMPLPEEVDAMRLTWSGLVGFADPLRPSVAGSIAACHEAGVRVVMITGDHPGTALSVARQSGLRADRVVTGAEFDELDSSELLHTARTVDLYARFRPEQKLRLVEALQADGQVVAMTGDGINDAPALKAAHIGIAMGSRGTDVAREAAALVLLDDDFTSLVRGIALGRRIYDNIGKAVGYVMAIHVAIAGTALIPILLGAPLILTPMLIALMELLIDPACSVVFEAEPADPDVMRRPPRPSGASLMNRRLVTSSLLQGLAALICVGGVYLWYEGQGAEPDFARTVTLLTLLLANAALVLEFRSAATRRRSGKTEHNLALRWGAVIAFPLLSLLFLSPAGRSLLQLSAIGLPDVATCFSAAALLWLGLHAIRRAFAR